MLGTACWALDDESSIYTTVFRAACSKAEAGGFLTKPRGSDDHRQLHINSHLTCSCGAGCLAGLAFIADD